MKIKHLRNFRECFFVCGEHDFAPVHPSGNVTPSLSDIKTTNQITKAEKLLDIQVLDHIIYTRENCYSFADDGQI